MGLLRAVKPWSEWIARWGFDMSKGDPDRSAENALQKIRSLVGDPALECEILSVSPWYVNQQYALEYSKGRVFCGGDAVHRHPPSSGLGLNTSVQDGFNLAWKLAYVVKGYASDDHLASYSEERAPVGRQIVARANQSRLYYAPMRTAFYGMPTGFSGSLEHFLDRFFASDEAGASARRQMLDVVGDGMFTLVTGIAGKVWEDAAASLGPPYLRTVRIGAGRYHDPYFYWARIRHIDEGGALLVRPDGVIAWRCPNAAANQRAAVSQLGSALDAVLGNPGITHPAGAVGSAA